MQEQDEDEYSFNMDELITFHKKPKWTEEYIELLRESDDSQLSVVKKTNVDSPIRQTVILKNWRSSPSTITLEPFRNIGIKNGYRFVPKAIDAHPPYKRDYFLPKKNMQLTVVSEELADTTATFDIDEDSEYVKVMDPYEQIAMEHQMARQELKCIALENNEEENYASDDDIDETSSEDNEDSYLKASDINYESNHDYMICEMPLELGGVVECILDDENTKTYNVQILQNDVAKYIDENMEGGLQEVCEGEIYDIYEDELGGPVKYENEENAHYYLNHIESGEASEQLNIDELKFEDSNSDLVLTSDIYSYDFSSITEVEQTQNNVNPMPSEETAVNDVDYSELEKYLEDYFSDI